MEQLQQSTFYHAESRVATTMATTWIVTEDEKIVVTSQTHFYCRISEKYVHVVFYYR